MIDDGNFQVFSILLHTRVDYFLLLFHQTLPNANIHTRTPHASMCVCSSVCIKAPACTIEANPLILMHTRWLPANFAFDARFNQNTRMEEHGMRCVRMQCTFRCCCFRCCLDYFNLGVILVVNK